MKLRSAVTPSTGSGEVFRPQVTGVDAVHHPHARVARQRGRQLALAHVDRVHARGPRLQQAVGKPARAGAEVAEHLPAHVGGKISQRLIQLLPSLRNEGALFGEHFYRVSFLHLVGSFPFLSVEKNAPLGEGARRLGAGRKAVRGEVYV